MDIADAIMEKPVGFSVGDRHFFLYPPTLGKVYLLSRFIDGLGINKDILNFNQYMEVLRLCREKKDIVCRIIAYHSIYRKDDLFNESEVNSRQELFMKELEEEDMCTLFSIVLSSDDAERYIRHFGLDKDKAEMGRISKIKKDKSNISFGGKSAYGSLIDFACQRYGWTMDYVVWGISYVNLKMLMADTPTAIYLNDEERKKLNIYDNETFIKADDPRNVQKILALKLN